MAPRVLVALFRASIERAQKAETRVVEHVDPETKFVCGRCLSDGFQGFFALIQNEFQRQKWVANGSLQCENRAALSLHGHIVPLNVNTCLLYTSPSPRDA